MIKKKNKVQHKILSSSTSQIELFYFGMQLLYEFQIIFTINTN